MASFISWGNQFYTIIRTQLFNITYLQIKLFSVSFLSIFPLFPQYPAGVLFIDTLSRVA